MTAHIAFPPSHEGDNFHTNFDARIAMAMPIATDILRKSFADADFTLEEAVSILEAEMPEFPASELPFLIQHLRLSKAVICGVPRRFQLSPERFADEVNEMYMSVLGYDPDFTWDADKGVFVTYEQVPSRLWLAPMEDGK